MRTAVRSLRRRVEPDDKHSIAAARRTLRALDLPKKRRHLDFYETNRAAVEALRARVRIEGVVYEPCVGFGAISRCFPDCEVITNDIDPAKDAHSHVDAAELVLDTIASDGPGSAWVVTNTPFGNTAFPIVRNLVDQGARCAFLLLLSFLEPTFDRGEWLEAHPPTGLIILPRHSFSADGRTFQVTCAWTLWGTERLEPLVQVVSKGPPRRSRQGQSAGTENEHSGGIAGHRGTR